MKIAVDIREIKKSNITGIGRFLRNFLDNVAQNEKKRIYLLADNNTDGSFYRDSFATIKISAPFTFWYDQISISQVLNKENIDIFFSPYYKIPFFAKCKKVMTIHDLHFLESILRKGIACLKPYIFYLRQAVKYADKIIAVSEFTKSEIISQFKVEENKIKVIHNGVDKKFRVVDRKGLSILKSKYNLNYNYILFVGNMEANKNLKGLIKAYSLLNNREKNDYKLVIIAKKNKNYSELREIVMNLPLDNNVIFLDFVCDDDLVLFYNFAQFFVFPSFYEGFGLPPVEAMACGAPVISSYTSSLREVLDEAALFVNPYDVADISAKISYLLSNDELKESLKSKGLNQSMKYNATVFSKNLLREIGSA